MSKNKRVGTAKLEQEDIDLDEYEDEDEDDGYKVVNGRIVRTPKEKLPSNTVVIELDYPLEIAGKEVNELTVRVPTVRDRRAVEKDKKSTMAEKEIKLFANLCDLTVDEFDNITARDYAKFTSAFRYFTDTLT